MNMAINHSDKGWWHSFCQEVKRAFRHNDFDMKVHLCELYERHMHQRYMREYLHYKQLEYDEMKAKGLLEKRLGFFDWLKDNRD